MELWLNGIEIVSNIISNKFELWSIIFFFFVFSPPKCNRMAWRGYRFCMKMQSLSG